jgi:hypothetical protein
MGTSPLLNESFEGLLLFQCDFYTTTEILLWWYYVIGLNGRSNKYQFHSLWFDQTGALSHGSNTLNARMLTITPPMR